MSSVRCHPESDRRRRTEEGPYVFAIDTEFGDGTTGKGTASAVPHAGSIDAALAAEGQLSSLNPGYAEQYLYSVAFCTSPRLTGF